MDHGFAFFVECALDLAYLILIALGFAVNINGCVYLTVPRFDPLNGFTDDLRELLDRGLWSLQTELNHKCIYNCQL